MEVKGQADLEKGAGQDRWRETLTQLTVSFTGEVFYATSPEKFTFQEAASECRRLGARLATTGQLYLAWQGGMDMCSAGWLADRSVRYPISKARPNCGGNLLGVRTVYVHANQTGYPDPSSRYDAICYTGGSGWDQRGLTPLDKPGWVPEKGKILEVVHSWGQ